jgi:cytochrome P450
MEGKNEGYKTSEHPTVFHELLKTDQLPEQDKNLQHLVDEGQTVVQAGQVTTTHMLYTTTFHILDNPSVLRKLREELADAMPDGKLAPLQKLEQLPYLSAVVSEGLRTSYGTFHRLQRVSPDEALIYKDWTIPPGTPLSIIPMFLHDNEQVFPEPKQFRPERWLKSGEQRERLEKYLVSFNRGSRGCLGQHLAQAEIYLLLAAIFRNFDMELYQTTFEDIETKHDFFNPQARAGSKYLRVIVN